VLVLLVAGLAVLVGDVAAAVNRAVIFGNSSYPTLCVSLSDLTQEAPLVTSRLSGTDVAWIISAYQDRSADDMASIITSTAALASDYLVVYYGGHGDASGDGGWYGTTWPCSRLLPQELVTALGGAASRSSVILDSCGSGAFADAVNAIDSDIAFITATTGHDCAEDAYFTPCLMQGIADGTADANGDGFITVREAGEFGIAHCTEGSTTPTWDGDLGNVRIAKSGADPTPVAGRTWGSIKILYR
jgi:hypothetical protein